MTEAVSNPSDLFFKERTGFGISEIQGIRSKLPLVFEGSVLHITTRNLGELEKRSGNDFYGRIIRPLCREVVSAGVANKGWPEQVITSDYSQIIFGNPLLNDGNASINHPIQALNSAKSLREKFGLISTGLAEDKLPTPEVDFLINSGWLIYCELGVPDLRQTFGYIGGILKETRKIAENIRGSNLGIYFGQRTKDLLKNEIVSSSVRTTRVPIYKFTG